MENLPTFLALCQVIHRRIFVTKCQLSLRWRHNGCDSVSNHQPRECLLRRWIRRTPKKTSKLRVTGLCVGNSPETGEFPAQMASYAENVSIWWRHHVWSFDICFVVSQGKLIKKTSSCRQWSETLGCSCDVTNETQQLIPHYLFARGKSYSRVSFHRPLEQTACSKAYPS